jgi:hypothetical protein
MNLSFHKLAKKKNRSHNENITTTQLNICQRNYKVCHTPGWKLDLSLLKKEKREGDDI